MLATNATSERSFRLCSLQRKSYLCSTMHQQQLNHLMTLHVHKAATDMLKSSDIASDFVGILMQVKKNWYNLTILFL